MTREAEAARMSEPLAVADNGLGPAAQQLPRLKQRRHLAEGKQAGDIRKRDGRAEPGFLQSLQFREAEEDDAGEDHARPALRGNVGAGDGADPIDGQGLGPYFRAAPVLDGSSLGGRDIPGVGLRHRPPWLEIYHRPLLLALAGPGSVDLVDLVLENAGLL